MAHGGTRHRTTAEKKRDLADATEPNREGKGVDRNRLLTTKTLRWSERSKRARRRRISTARLDDGCTVNRRGRRDAATPGTTARRRRRGGRGEPSCGGDWLEEARSGGNGAAKHGGARARVCSGSRRTERGREGKQGERGEERVGVLIHLRGGSGRSETRREARATARVATAAGEEDDRGVFHGAPWTFRWQKQLGPFPFSFCFLFISFQ